MATIKDRRLKFMRTHRQSAFTLLELLVVVLIISIMTAFVVVKLDGNPLRKLSAEAERLMLLVNLAQQEAVMSSRVWKLTFEPEFNRYSFSKWKEQEFELVDNPPFNGAYQMKQADWKDLMVNAEATKETIEVLMFPSGEHDQFSIQLNSGEFQRVVSMGPVGWAVLN